MKSGIKINGKELTATEVVENSKKLIESLRNSNDSDKGLLITIEEERIERFKEDAKREQEDAKRKALLEKLAKYTNQ